MIGRILRTPEFERVAALPRRVADFGRTAQACADVLTREFRRPGGAMSLTPAQGLALAELIENRGAFLGYPVGTGKTLISYLAILALESQRPGIVLPAAHITSGKAEQDFADLAKHWRSLPVNPRLFSVESLALESQSTALQDAHLDLLIIDKGAQCKFAWLGGACAMP
jgi:N12 class adenine-specific DNA methylase